MALQIAYLDVPHEGVMEAARRIQAKAGTCLVLPSARFSVYQGGRVVLSSLVCDERLGGQSTGTAAEGCTNCVRSGRVGHPPEAKPMPDVEAAKRALREAIGEMRSVMCDGVPSCARNAILSALRALGEETP